MKLLGWMHRKFRQNSDETLKDFAIDNGRTHMNGQPQYPEQYYYGKPVYGTKFYRQTDVDYFRQSFTGMETIDDEEKLENSEIFHGFLAIGTLGLGSDHEISTTPSTPTFAISFEESGKETEVTETQLKLLEDNLEKILGADVKEEISDVSSGRNSHVSAGRSSQGSTITLSGKTLELPESNKNGGNSHICPLQGYLFGSAIELPETKAVKKEHRTSLKDLFQKSKIIDEYGGERCEKDSDKSAVKMMKKMLKKKVSQVSRSSSTTTYGSRSATSGETKLKKILHIFHKKVHPERSNSSKKHMELPKEKMYRNGEHQNMITAENGTRYCYKNQINPEISLSSDSNGNREFWIKSDADYLVLEL